MKEQNPTVLVVDDVPANLAFLFDYLEQEGFRVLVAQSGANALLQIQHLKPDIILLDVIMPGLDGFETCRLLKGNPETCEIPVIFLTAMDDPVDKVRGFELGGVDYITKPLSEMEVLARLRTHLTIGHLQNRLKRQLEFAQLEVQERNMELSRTNAQLSRLNGSYQSEMAQREQERVEKDKLLNIIEKQVKQWERLSTYLVSEAESPRTSLARALNQQASQNLSLVQHSLDFIFQSLADGGSVDALSAHRAYVLEILASIKSYLDEAAAKKPPVCEDALSTLTPREQEIFHLLVDGKSHAEISEILILNESSVRSYRSRLMKKLEIDSLAGLIKFAIKHNLTELD